MVAFSYDDTLCIWEFSKSLTNRAYTQYINLKPGSIRDYVLLVSLLNSKFFCAVAKFSLAELDRVRQYPGEDLDAYIRRFCDRALDCCDLIEEKMLVDVYLLGMIEEYSIVYGICLSHHSPS